MSSEQQDKLKEQQRHYLPAALNRVFAISSIGLLLVTLWSVVDDYTRPWKGYQRRFVDMEKARIREEIGKTQAQIDQAQRNDLLAKREAAVAEVAQRQDRVTAIDAELEGMTNDLYVADQKARFTKALLDTARYEYQEAVNHRPERTEHALAEMTRLQEELAAATDANKQILGRAEALKSERRDLTAAVDRLDSQLAEMDRETERLGRGLAAIDKPFAHAVLNAPMLDFINPTLKIQQAVVTGIENDINYLRIPRVDRCATCHAGIDRPQYVGAAAPFTAHPNLDLMGSDSSPHPFGKVGCTICHFGRDRATGFNEAVHMPDTPEDAERWEKEHHWHRLHHWDYPMSPRRYAEAGCLQCHMGNVALPGAERLSQGKRLFETLGCHGCHKVAGWENLRKVGPPLDAVATKTTPEWVGHWLAEPRGYNPTTRMPHFWYLGNSSGPEDRPRNAVEIEGVVEYLFARSKTGRYPAPPRGDAARGKKLIENVGCHGCHSAIGPLEDHAEADPRSHGPNIMRIGSKTYPGWIYEWVRNPRNYWSETWMPDLRLTAPEAADITAYLEGLQDPSWTEEPARRLDVPEEEKRSTRDEILLFHLMRKQTREQAESQLAALSEDEKKIMVGEKTIARLGCFGCHLIPGFENAQRIGTELTQEGSKYVDRFDFGFLHIPRERDAWLFQKLKDTRSFDQGKSLSPDEELKMPQFGLSDDEIESLVTVLLGLKIDEVAPHQKQVLDGRQAAIEAGWRVATDYNCMGCHLVQGQGGDIRPWIEKVKGREGLNASEAAAFAPPNLHTEGAKVQSDWLFEFLKNVSPIRPWLQVRMPSFHLADKQVNTLTTFFAALEQADYPFVDYRAGFALEGATRTSAERLASQEYLNCLSCHVAGDKTPNTTPDNWAPNLALARDRLRTDWIHRWLRDPQVIAPGTRMPSYFLDEQSGPPDILDGDENAQMDLLARWVMSLGERQPQPPFPLYRQPPPVSLQAEGPARPAPQGATAGGGAR